MNILAIIPARGGSKGLPGKNIRELCGKPLIAWTIETALECDLVTRALVSTDSEDIANISRQYGAEVPFIRPSIFAQDDTPDFPVYKHACEYLLEHEEYTPDICVWLRPTAPLRIHSDVSNAIKILRGHRDKACVRSVTLVKHHPYWMKSLKDGKLVSFLPDRDETVYFRRQLLPDLYSFNGCVEVFWHDDAIECGDLFNGRTMLPLVMPEERSIDIETLYDFQMSEFLKSR